MTATQLTTEDAAILSRVTRKDAAAALALRQADKDDSTLMLRAAYVRQDMTGFYPAPRAARAMQTELAAVGTARLLTPKTPLAMVTEHISGACYCDEGEPCGVMAD